MRALYRHCTHFRDRPILTTPKTDRGADSPYPADAVVAFVHVETVDLLNPRMAQIELVKNLKSLAGLWRTETIALHLSTHLAWKSAEPEAARGWLKGVAECLEECGYQAVQTPDGYFSDMAAPQPAPKLRLVVAEAG